MSRPRKGTKVPEPLESQGPEMSPVRPLLHADGPEDPWLRLIPLIEEWGHATRELGNDLSFPEARVILAARYLRTRGTPDSWSGHRVVLRGIHSALGEEPPTITILAMAKAAADGTDADPQFFPPPPVATWMERLDEILATEELVAQKAMDIVTQAGYKFDAEKGVLTAATGRVGGPPKHFGSVVWELYKHFSGYPNTPKTPTQYAVEWREQIAEQLRLFFPAEWLSTAPGGTEAQIANAIRNGIKRT